MKFEGVYTALVSPFKAGKLDIESYLKLLDQQQRAGVRGFVVNGTTGESPCLHWTEVESLFREARAFLSSDCKLVLGTGSNNTQSSVEMNKKAQALKVDGILSVVPYYNKPTQEGLFQHFSTIAQNTDLPILLYNIPGRSVVSLSLETMNRLAAHKNIVGIKEAKGDASFIEEISAICPKWDLLSGDDETYLQAALGSCRGVISVISHLIPKEFIAWTKRAQNKEGNILDEYREYDVLCQLLFKEANPTPVKYALMKMGIIASDEVRLPLVGCSAGLKKEIDQELGRLNLCPH